MLINLIRWFPPPPLPKSEFTSPQIITLHTECTYINISPPATMFLRASWVISTLKKTKQLAAKEKKIQKSWEYGSYSYHQGKFWYSITRGIQCSCMALMPLCWIQFNSIARCDTQDLDRILENGDIVFKSVNKLRIEDLPS